MKLGACSSKYDWFVFTWYYYNKINAVISTHVNFWAGTEQFEENLIQKIRIVSFTTIIYAEQFHRLNTSGSRLCKQSCTAEAEFHLRYGVSLSPSSHSRLGALLRVQPFIMIEENTEFTLWWWNITGWL